MKLPSFSTLFIVLVFLMMLLCALVVAFACPPAKFKTGELIELENGARLFITSREYDEKRKSWLYELHYAKDGHPPVAVLKESEVKPVGR